MVGPSSSSQLDSPELCRNISVAVSSSSSQLQSLVASPSIFILSPDSSTTPSLCSTLTSITSSELFSGSSLVTGASPETFGGAACQQWRP
ncbi:hypothetical protein QVD17_09053 [Tagetes erecta]|uniref:Uncharacterized protein n=1 Tax=Tagetes erecta TaxID=13708 RepID=A0AAD8L3J5_TARER|nr:hypothetical protein QVD17_09053 [Tagetes erecta]